MSDREVGSGAQVDRDDCHSGVCGRSLLRRRTDRGRSVKLVWHLLSWPRGFGLVRVETNEGCLREAVPTPTGWGLGAPAPLPPSSKLESREAALTPIGWGFGAPAPLPPSSKLKPK